MREKNVRRRKKWKAARDVRSSGKSREQVIMARKKQTNDTDGLIVESLDFLQEDSLKEGEITLGHCAVGEARALHYLRSSTK